jgi:trehalose-phosphatase
VIPLVRPADLAHRVIEAGRGRGLAAIFDLDGTLAPIARRPDFARVPTATLCALRKLAKRKDTTVGVVSGRPLHDVIGLLGPTRGKLWIAGIHGYEQQAPGESIQSLWSAAEEREARFQAASIEAKVAGIRGILIERKGPVVAVHVRAATPARRRRAATAARRGLLRGWRVVAGRRVIEIRPGQGPTKGDAVHWIASTRSDAVILYVGDDTTDEDAFIALGRMDFGVLVGGRSAHAERGAVRRSVTRAAWRLSGPAAVGRLIERLAVAA